MHSLFRNISVLTLLLVSFNYIFCQDIQEGLETGLQAIKTLHHGTEDEKFKVLTSLDEWGIMSVLSMARVSFLLIHEDKEWLEDEVEQNLLHKYHALNAAMDDFRSHLSKNNRLMIELDQLPKSLDTISAHVKLMDKQINKLLNHSEKNNEQKDENIQHFLSMYEERHSNFSDLIYSAMVNSRHNIFQDATKQFSYHREEVLQFIKASILLLKNSVTLDITYKMLKYVDVIDGEETDELEEIMESSYGLWLERFRNLAHVIQETETDLKNAWNRQLPADVEKFLEFLSHKSFESSSVYAQLFDFLKKKYPWRRWSVVVTSSELRLKKEIDVTMCDRYGYTKYDVFSQKHIFVSSTELKSSELNRDKALEHLKLTIEPLETWTEDLEKARIIKEKMHLSCSEFSMFGVLQDTRDSDVVITGTFEAAETFVKNIKEKQKETPFKSFIVG